MRPTIEFICKGSGEPETNDDGERVWASTRGWSLSTVYGRVELTFRLYGRATCEELAAIYLVIGYATVRQIPVTLHLEAPLPSRIPLAEENE